MAKQKPVPFTAHDYRLIVVVVLLCTLCFYFLFEIEMSKFSTVVSYDYWENSSAPQSSEQPKAAAIAASELNSSNGVSSQHISSESLPKPVTPPPPVASQTPSSTAIDSPSEIDMNDYSFEEQAEMDAAPPPENIPPPMTDTPSQPDYTEPLEPEHDDASDTEYTGMVNINTASLEMLCSLEGVGEVTAQNIIQFRETAGAFREITDLMLVKGIGNSKFEAIRHRIEI